MLLIVLIKYQTYALIMPLLTDAVPAAHLSITEEIPI